MQTSEYVGICTWSLWFLGFFVNGYLSFICHFLGSYYSFITVHDASHGNASMFFGRFSSIPLLVPFDEFKKLHQLHHAHVNCPNEDPDYIMHNISPICWFFAPEVYVLYYIRKASMLSRNRCAIMLGLLRYLFFIVLVVGSSLIFGVKWSMMHLLLPSRCAFALLVYLLDYLPHYGFGAWGRNNCARNLWNGEAPLWLALLTQNQCYHSAHHKQPHIPTLSLDDFSKKPSATDS